MSEHKMMRGVLNSNSNGNLTHAGFTLQQPFWISALNGCSFSLCQAWSRFPVPDTSLWALKGDSLWRTALTLSFWDFADPGSETKACFCSWSISAGHATKAHGSQVGAPGGLVMWFMVSDTPLSCTQMLVCVLWTSPAAWIPRSTPAALFWTFPPPICNT